MGRGTWVEEGCTAPSPVMGKLAVWGLLGIVEMRSWLGRVGWARALIALAPWIALLVVGEAFVLLQKDQRPSQKADQEHYEARYFCPPAPPEKEKSEADDPKDGREPGDVACLDRTVTWSRAKADNLDLRAYLLVVTAVLGALGTLAVLYVAGDRRAAERGILKAEVTGPGPRAQVRLTNIGKTPVRLLALGNLNLDWDPVRSPDRDYWAGLDRMWQLIEPGSEASTDFAANLDRIVAHGGFVIVLEYEDVFGDRWRARAGFKKGAAPGVYIHQGEAEERKL